MTSLRSLLTRLAAAFLVAASIAAPALASPGPPMGARVRLPAGTEGRYFEGTCARVTTDSLWLTLDRTGETLGYPHAALAGLEMASGERPSPGKALAAGLTGGALMGALIGALAPRVRHAESEGEGGGGEDDEGPRSALAATTPSVTPEDHTVFNATLGAVIGAVAGGLIGAVTGLNQRETAWASITLTGASPGDGDTPGLRLAMRVRWTHR